MVWLLLGGPARTVARPVQRLGTTVGRRRSGTQSAFAPDFPWARDRCVGMSDALGWIEHEAIEGTEGIGSALDFQIRAFHVSVYSSRHGRV